LDNCQKRFTSAVFASLIESLQTVPEGVSRSNKRTFILSCAAPTRYATVRRQVNIR
jgi:hypothetical protein